MDFHAGKIDEANVAPPGAHEFDDDRVCRRLDFGALERLPHRGLISDPKRRAEPACLSLEGPQQAKARAEGQFG